ncbi:MAG TPA: pitrilysin family protein [Vicinamibacterales bacterium]
MKTPTVVAALILWAVVGGSAARAQNADRQWPSEAPPRPLPARDVKFPPYEIRTLGNGLRVVTVLHHEQPVVSMRMIVRAGSSLDPKEKLGLAHLAASLLDQGTTTKSASEMNDAIDFIGGAMGAGAGTDLSFANLVVMKDSFETGLQMLSDMVRHPAFAPAEIERQRQQILSNLTVSLEDPEYVADAVFDRLVYGSHPYGLPHSGTPKTLSAISRDDLVQFHARNFVPNNAILAIVGDVTAEEAFAGAGKVFGDWPRGEVPRPALTAAPEPARRVVIVNKPDAVQTEVRVGHLGIKRDNADYMALNLTLRILGGEGANRLHQVLRTERGLTYGAKADMDTLLESGDFEASTSTRSPATAEVLRLIVDEFWRLQRERVGERELNDAKAYITGSFPLTIETPDAIATQVLNVLFYGLPVEQLQSFRDRVNAVRTDDIERVARSFLRPDRLAVVLVGNAAAFAPQLRGVGFGNYEVVDIDQLDLLAADFKAPAAARPGGAARPPVATGAQPRYAQTNAPATRQRPTITPQEGDAARALLDKVIAAKGGLERLRGVRNLVVTTSEEGSGPGNERRTVQVTTTLEYPNHVRIEMKTDVGPVVRGYDGTRAWAKDPQGIQDIPDAMIQELKASLRRDTITALIAAADNRLRVRLLPDVKDETGTLHHALEFSAPDLDPMVIYVDPATSLITKQTYVSGGMGRALVEELFGDYKAVDGIQVAHTARVRIGGQQVLERRITDVTVNAPLSPTLFRRPTS